MQDVLPFVLVGFVAQMIDGALGMAYGVTSTTFLLSIGIPPMFASASVHAAEVFTTAVSGLSHWRLGNVRKYLVAKLIIPGVIGGIMGAYVLTELDGDKIKPYVSAYLLVMGLLIIFKAIRITAHREVRTHLMPLGFIGGFFDAIGGGGWGPIVTSTLVARGNHPRFTVGSVNLTEFFVTLAESLTFFLAINVGEYWRIILGLLIGGVIAAPLAAYMLKRLPVRALMLLVGILISILSIRTIYLALR